MNVAGIDVGTNTVRLLVLDEHARVLDRGREITRLGQGVDAARTLRPQAVDRTLHAIASHVDRAQAAGAGRIRIIGTSVLRDATDATTFREVVLDRTGVRLDVLSGAEEGALAFAGATLGLSADACVVCDIGGGSTELVVRDRPAISMNIGSVRIRERCLPSEPPTEQEIERARAVVDAVVEPALAQLGPLIDHELVGVAGTITTVAAVALGLRVYDHDAVHHSVLDRDTVAEWSDRLLAMTPSDILGLGPVEPGRADVIGAGSLVLRRVMELGDLDEVLISETDILDGLARSLLDPIA